MMATSTSTIEKDIEEDDNDEYWEKNVRVTNSNN
jgi:hypothetical protein